MRITNELRAYLTAKVTEIIPEPTSKEDAQKVYNALANLNTQYRLYIEQKTQEFIEEAFKNPIFKGCLIEPCSYGKPSLSTGTGSSPTVLQHCADNAECNKFRESAVQKIIALLSVQKEVSDLDSFIVSVVSTIK